MALKILQVLLLLGSIYQMAENTITLRSYTQWCQPAATFTMAVTDMITTGTSAGQVPKYDYVTFFQNVNKESVALLLNFNGFSTNWIVYWIDKSTTVWNQRTFPYQSGSFLNMINNFLFQMAGSTYYALKVNDADAANPVWYTFNTTDYAAGGYMKFFPYSVDFVTNSIYVLLQDLTTSKVVTYRWVSGTLTMNPISVSPLLPFWPQDAIGNGVYMYDKTNNRFVRLVNNAWETTTFVLISDNTDIVKVYPMREQIMFISVTKTSLKLGDLYLINGNTEYKFTINQQVSTTDVAYFSDEVNNFMRVVNYEFLWVTITSTKESRVSLINQTEIPNIGLIMSVAMSQNKAGIFYSDGKVAYYKHIANNTLEKQFTRTASMTMDLSQNKTYQIAVSCICNTINQMACFSQGLNCLIITKAAASCKSAGDSYTTW